MLALNLMIANLERQHGLYRELESVLTAQQAALLARDTDALDASNRRQLPLVDALAAAETERQGLLPDHPGGVRRLADLEKLAAEPQLRSRWEQLAGTLPVLVQRVTGLTRTNRVLATDAVMNCAYLLRLLGLEEGATYVHPEQASPRSVPSLRLDVRA